MRSVDPSVDAILIDLSRSPLQGRAVAIEFRKRAATRNVPIIFVGGLPEKVDAIKKVMPDAGFVDWQDIPESLTAAIQAAPEKPLTPDTMAGYSGTPLAKKLNIRENVTLALLGAPDGFEAKLDPLPSGVRIVTKARNADRAILFITAFKELERKWQLTVDALADRATLWIAWPKKASKIVTDVTEINIRAYGLGRGWVDYKICAIDETWSGLAFAKRKEAKPA